MNDYSHRKVSTAAKRITQINECLKKPGSFSIHISQRFLQPKILIQKHEKLKTTKKELIRDIFNLLN